MQKEKIVPAIRFKGFKEEWKEKKINQILIPIVSDLTMLCIQEKEPYPVYDANNIVGYSSYALSSVPYLTIIKDGAGVGRTRKLPANSSFLGTMTGLIPKNSDIDFTYNLMSSLKLEKNFSGSTIPHIYFSDYGKYLVYVPSIIEQQKIGLFLSNLDILITCVERNLDKLQTIKQSLLNNMFASFERKMPKIRFKAFEENFEVIRLNEIAEYKNGKGHEKFVLEKGKYILVNSKFISSNASQCKYTNINISPLFKNDIVMVLSDIPGGKALAKTFLIDNDNKYALNQRICALTSKSTSPIYLSIILNRNSQLLALDDHVNQTNINRQQVMDLLLLIPSYAEQQKIGQFFSNLDSLIHSQEQKLEKLNNIKQALLEKMFC
ncbi:restriction endonuclease subunit S [Mycoplasma sp. B6188]|uniref:restriction endonuclease subunit S n=1 Tax=Mycoplasma sp. B6188 TaxID=3401673 RepID=UPI003AAC1559